MFKWNSVTGNDEPKLGDVSRDPVVLGDSRLPQQSRVNGKKAKPQRLNVRRNPFYTKRLEPFVSEKIIVAPSAKPFAHASLDLQRTNLSQTCGVQQVIGIKNYGGDAEIVENEITGEASAFKHLPVLRKYGVDESVKMAASGKKRLSGEARMRNTPNQRKRTINEAVVGAGAQRGRCRVARVIFFLAYHNSSPFN